ncbi:MAG TPA: RluA family pseudouridine synthase [Verrucomicrobiae bacterium]|nr:RluA family pseudouridine synthase [Verrucomicrobiae bacterium]
MSAAVKLSSPATNEFWEIPVLFEDEHLLALDKPAKLLTSPDRYDPNRPNLMKLLHAGIEQQKPWARERNLNYLANAHRLDFETSGVILLAKSKPVLVALANLFGAEKPSKKYIALVRGEIIENQFEVDAALAPHPVKVGVMRMDPKKGKKSKTKFTVLENFSQFGYALLRCEPLTGRTHQIRVHAAHAGLKIVGDELYGGKALWLSRLKKDYRLKEGREERPLISRVALHAEELELSHPVTHETVKITAPWPKDLRVAVKYLRQYSNSAEANQRGEENDV